jgi:hypothetical protein
MAHDGGVMSSDLPDRPSLEHLRRQARERLRELRVRKPGTQLADAQHAIARDYGFPSWPKLKAHVDAVTSSTHAASSDAAARALAVHLRDNDGRLVGVALFVPTVRYASTFIDGTSAARERTLTRAVWRAIDRWVMAGDSGLPARPAPLIQAVVTALLGTERSAVSGHRVASFPMKAQTRASLHSTVSRLLPRLASV